MRLCLYFTRRQLFYLFDSLRTQLRLPFLLAFVSFPPSQGIQPQLADILFSLGGALAIPQLNGAVSWIFDDRFFSKLVIFKIYIFAFI